MKVSKAPKRQLSPQMQKLDSKLKQAAELYEKQFLRQMVKAMRKSVSHSAMTKPGMAEGIYREQLDEKYVDNWVGGGGTGFAEMVYDELVTKFFPQLGSAKPKVVRPINLSDRFQGVSRSLTEGAIKKQTFNIQLQAQKPDQSGLLNVPWKAQFKKEFVMEDGKTAVELLHPDSGLRSKLVFTGQVKPGLLNKTLSQGESFAQLGPEAQSLTWQITGPNSRKDSSQNGKPSLNE